MSEIDFSELMDPDLAKKRLKDMLDNGEIDIEEYNERVTELGVQF